MAPENQFTENMTAVELHLYSMQEHPLLPHF
jgi:hypothetical protein